MKKQPEITAKTKAKIMNAFWELYRESRIEKISIGAIMKKAGYNRGTFYEYFIDIYDLLDQFEDQILDRFSSKSDEYFRHNSKDHIDLGELSRGVAMVLSQYEEELFILLSKESTFRQKISNNIRDRAFHLIGLDESDPYIEYYINYIVFNLTNMLAYWHSTGKKLPVEEILSISQLLIFQGVKGCLEKYSSISFQNIHF